MNKTFELTRQHLDLLSHMYVGWCGDEFGAPEINPKRPYGNSDVVTDIADILGFDPSEVNYDDLVELHEDTQTALQIVLFTQSFVPGTYQSSRYGIDWSLIE